VTHRGRTVVLALADKIHVSSSNSQHLRGDNAAIYVDGCVALRGDAPAQGWLVSG
jgi:hypothetical protein